MSRHISTQFTSWYNYNSDNIIYVIKCNHAFHIVVNYNYNSKFTYIYFNDIISSDVLYHVSRNGH